MFKAGVWILVVLSTAVLAEEKSSYSVLHSGDKQRMIQGGSWKRGCPVALEDLRLLHVRYHNFQGKKQWGEMVVHRRVADEVVEIFESLYKIGYPIRQMRLVSSFRGSDWRSIEADNTSAFNCRKATGSQHWSKHSYGQAIDLNPIENPYIARNGRISHKASQPYRRRRHQHKSAGDRALLLANDPAVAIFKKYGWKWGGEWQGVKDYQHFFK